MQQPISPLARTLSPYVPGEQPKAGEVFVKLNTNENPYPPAPGVHPAIAAALANLPLYPDPTSAALRAVIARRHGVGVDQVFVGNGSDEVLGLCFPAFFAGQPLPTRFADITYSFYPVYAQLFGVAYEQLPLRDDFTLDLEGYRSSPCGGILIANPNAPTGLALPAQALLALAKAQPQCAVIIDEAYVEFGAESVLPLIDQAPNLLVVRTLSKSHALAGLRVGYAVGAPALIAALTAVKDSFNSYPLDCLAQAGACAALSDDAYTERISLVIQRTRDYTVSELQARGFDVLDSRSNFLFARPADGNAAALQQALRAQGILVRHFNKPRINDRLRISIGTQAQMEQLIQALDAIQQEGPA